MPIWIKIDSATPPATRDPQVYCASLFDMHDGPDTYMLRHEWGMEIVQTMSAPPVSKIAGIAPAQQGPKINIDPVFFCIHCRGPIFEYTERSSQPPHTGVSDAEAPAPQES